MKKTLGVLVMTAMVSGFMACGNSKAPAPVSEEAGPVEVEETIDSTDIDTSTVVTRGGTESEGFGRCSESDCNCKSFKGRGDTCGNCGHAYKSHY